jgi:hypothetical protein
MYESSWEILFIIDTSLFRCVSSTSFSNNGHPLFPLYLSSLQSRVFLSIEGRVISPHFLPRENIPTDDYIHGAVSIPPPKNFGRRRQRRRRTQQFPRCCCCSLTIPFLIFFCLLIFAFFLALRFSVRTIPSPLPKKVNTELSNYAST